MHLDLSVFYCVLWSLVSVIFSAALCPCGCECLVVELVVGLYACVIGIVGCRPMC